MKATYDYHRSERQMSLGRFDFETFIRGCLGLRTRVPEPARRSSFLLEEPHPDFEDTMPAARAAMTPLP